MHLLAFKPAVLSISRHRCVLRPDFEKKRWHFESRMFVLRPDFDGNMQEFPPRRLFNKEKTKGLMCQVNFDTIYSMQMKALYTESLILLKCSDDPDYDVEVTNTHKYAIVYPIMT